MYRNKKTQKYKNIKSTKVQKNTLVPAMSTKRKREQSIKRAENIKKALVPAILHRIFRSCIWILQKIK